MSSSQRSPNIEECKQTIAFGSAGHAPVYTLLNPTIFDVASMKKRVSDDVKSVCLRTNGHR